MPYQPIENYGIIGDLHTVALVGMNGSIDFLCFPHFDSPSVFAALLDHEKGGRYQIYPILCDPRPKQLYLPDTNVLLTRYLSPEGVAEVSDFMPIHSMYHSHVVIRRAKCIRGEVHFRMTCEPRFNYARATHRVERGEKELLFISEGDDGTVLRLRSTHPLEVVNGDGKAEFTLSSGETATFVLEETGREERSRPCPIEAVPEAFKKTVNFWRNWLNKSSYRGRWRETVNRSALTLKLLFSEPHGSLVAAPTFGLPETIGGERNWDYRYTWIRDASFTLYGLIRLGFTEEASAFMQWLEARCAELSPDGSLQIMYGTDGRHELTEETLSHLEGYRKSAPVRIGNGAYDQLQLDIYGELMDSVYLSNKYGEPISFDLWQNLVRLNDWVCKNWRKPDEGIWEVRGGKKHFLYSRLMCWVAIDRAIRLAHKRSFPAPLDRWYKTRDEIHHDITANFWNRKRNAFIQHKGAVTTDASSLLMPLVKFIGPTDPRWLSTLRAIEEDLVHDSLVFRYRIGEAASDGLEGEEGTFSMCTFWYAECLSRAGDVEKARFYFEKMLGYANHLGLYAEELGPSGEHLGNFPQAFTHLGLISAAHNLDRMLSKGSGRENPGE
ncbi:MAG: glycoside hydrolase family 15 protein [Deltaproteobacteria bacterium]|nr:glycoside hydrolase family 15 protein [Deltaproteobacteria bacterium]NIS78050.1 glycoside hydrolase family 15 protein [Deltaproteobacteria bacterium]